MTSWLKTNRILGVNKIRKAMDELKTKEFLFQYFSAYIRMGKNRDFQIMAFWGHHSLKCAQTALRGKAHTMSGSYRGCLAREISVFLRMVFESRKDYPKQTLFVKIIYFIKCIY